MTLAELIASFKIAFPEFAEIPDAVLTYYGELTELHVCAGTWGKQFPFAFHQYLAHLLVVTDALSQVPEPVVDPLAIPDEACCDAPLEPGQLIASDSVGDVSVSFDNSALNAAKNKLKKDEISIDLSRTKYGLLYLSMRRRLGLSFGTTSGITTIPCYRRAGYPSWAGS